MINSILPHYLQYIKMVKISHFVGGTCFVWSGFDIETLVRVGQVMSDYWISDRALKIWWIA